MGADLSRIRSNPLLDFAGVELKQGGVLLDADFNEFVAVVDRRLRAAASDILGRSTVSSTTPDAFKITAVAGALSIGQGRLYVDGLLAENHGAASPDPAKRLFDPVMAEPTFADPVGYAAQPYLPNAPALSTTGTHLVYLDVWQRELTYLERPELVETAVGVETSSRLQTVWQVRVLGDDADGATCASPDEDVAGWSELIAPSSGRLTTGTFDVPPSSDPCELPPTGGYRGLENQTYRVEIHDPGLPGGTATFKWSRDNACVGSRVASMVSAAELELQTLGRDDVLRFNTGDWVEIIDDVREFSQRCGEMRRVTVDEAARRIAFAPALPAEMLPAPPTFPDSDSPRIRNLRVRRWDQKGKVLRIGPGGTTPQFQDLDASGSAGVINVPPAGTTLLLENGVTVSFASTGAKGFKAGDHWEFAARSADASVELLTDAPPRGIHHHYERLGIWDVDARTVTDCRHRWPPAVEGHDCGCTACVTLESHASGQFTIQDAVNQVSQTGGTVCLGPGTYALREPVRIQNARSLRVRGQGWATVLAATAGGGALEVRESIGVHIENLTVVTSTRQETADAIALANSLLVALEDCVVLNVPDGRGAAVGLDGYLLGATIERCALAARTGISGGRRINGYLATASLRITDNWFQCTQRGLELERFAIHLAETRIEGNTVRGCLDAGLVATGANAPAGAFNVSGNLCEVQGTGIVVGVDAARLSENDVRSAGGAKAGDGIVLARGLDPGGVDHCQVLGNRIRGMPGNGIAIRTRVNSGMIKHNVIAETGGGGIVMEGDGEAGQLVVENNQLLDIARSAAPRGSHLAGMRFVATADLDVSSNLVNRFARDALLSAAQASVQVLAAQRVRIAGNRLTGIGPPTGFVGRSTGIEIVPPFRSAQIAENRVLRRGGDERIGSGRWVGLRVAAASDDASPNTGRFFASGDVAILSVADRSLVLTTSRIFGTPRVPAEALVGFGDVGARANEIESEASTEGPVLIAGAQSCVVTDNRWALAATTQSPSPPSRVRSMRAVVSNNDLRGPGEEGSVVLEIVPPGKDQPAVLGNIRNGKITVRGAPLGEPWASLNPLSHD
jgi:hypothetical protein